LKTFLFLVAAAILKRAGLSDTILKGTHPGAILARFGTKMAAKLKIEKRGVKF
jgi:hypothetical protein